MKHIRILVTIALAVLVGSESLAQTYPTKPITFVVALAPGGAADVIARAMGQRLTELLGQPIIVENRSGANTQIAADYVAKMAPDGYTLLVTAEHTFTVNQFLYHKLQYDPAKDFTPVSGLVAVDQALIVNPSTSMKNVSDLIALAKAKPGEVSYGSLGVGSGPHLSMVQLQRAAGIKLNAVQYKGAAPAINDIMGDHIPVMFASTGLVAAANAAGKLKLLGIGSAKRLAQLPNVPAIAEILPGFRARLWFGVFTPSGTSRDIVVKLNTAIQGVLADPKFRDTILIPNFYEPMTGSPDQFSEQIKTDAAKWGKLIADEKITIDE